MEYRDIYDEQRNLTGIRRARHEKLAPGEFIIAVGIWIFNSQGKLLMIQRHPDKSFAPLKWDAPAGHVTAGETPVQAAVRELFEETGILVKEEELVLIGTAIVPPYIGDNFCLYRDVSAEDVVFQEGETCAAKWITYEEMLHMSETGEISPSTIEHHKPIQKRFMELLDQAKR